MDTPSDGFEQEAIYPVSIEVPAAIEDRNRLTVAFRFFLALPHVILVGTPLAFVGLQWSNDHGMTWGWGSGGGVLGIVACVCAMIAWFAIVFAGRLCAYYLAWRVRASAYAALLRDEYPPFGEGDYPARLTLAPPEGERDRVTVLLRILLAIPHFILLWLLGVAWAITTAIAWLVILVTGKYPESLYGFALGVLAWDIRVESYVLLLRDEYPPFTLRV